MTMELQPIDPEFPHPTIAETNRRYRGLSTENKALAAKIFYDVWTEIEKENGTDIIGCISRVAEKYGCGGLRKTVENSTVHIAP